MRNSITKDRALSCRMCIPHLLGFLVLLKRGTDFQVFHVGESCTGCVTIRKPTSKTLIDTAMACELREGLPRERPTARGGTRLPITTGVVLIY